MRKRQEFNLPMLVITLVLGCAVWFLCAALHGVLEDSAPGPLLIGLLFGVLALALAAGVFMISSISGTFEKNLVTGGGAGSVMAFLAAGVLLLAGLAALFQWIYSLRFRPEAMEPTSYIFLIDDSGSMDGSDPQQLRYSAIGQVLQDQDPDFQYMVYGFADEVELLREMQPVSAGAEQLTGIHSGGTAIKLVLEQVLDDFQNKRWDGGGAPKVVLLTDGYPTDFVSFSAISGILREYTQNNISISTVGLGGADAALMKKIASRTNGVFIDIQDAALLEEAMTTAAVHYSVGDLVTTRYDSGSLSGLFGFLRVLFVTILGTGIGLLAMTAYGQPDSMSLILLSSIVKSLAGALLLELLTSLLDLPDGPLWFLLWVLIAATLCTRTAAAPSERSRRERSPRPSNARRGRANRNIR